MQNLSARLLSKVSFVATWNLSYLTVTFKLSSMLLMRLSAGNQPIYRLVFFLFNLHNQLQCICKWLFDFICLIPSSYLADVILGFVLVDDLEGSNLPIWIGEDLQCQLTTPVVCQKIFLLRPRQRHKESRWIISHQAFLIGILLQRIGFFALIMK